MKKLGNVMRRFHDEEEGAALIEYSILVGIISATAIAAVAAVALWITGRWTLLCGNLGIVC